MKSMQRMVVTAVLVAGMLLGTAGVATAGSLDNYGGVSAKTRVAVMKEVRRYKGWDPSRIACIISRESGFNPRAVNWNDSHGGSHGLGQINGVHARGFSDVWARRYTIRGGVEMMYRLWRGAGYSPWSGGSHPC